MRIAAQLAFLTQAATQASSPEQSSPIDSGRYW